ncbi:hypothetical protein BDV25DRAFT_140258 [Aspergillus avenaceus]|uniref:2EXR domain-containing protein n=1 Tax=Aspergillus avenaceus TaxID=36643 RepID=A0A5N6TUF7_ASPAV|nr:hypothetical protein BDV25DRAFT_140258 [Aspergillus avenaceus]
MATSTFTLFPKLPPELRNRIWQDALPQRFVFCHELLDPIQLEVPFLLVNSEARGIALTWIQEQGLKRSSHKDRRIPIFLRLFDPKNDTLYISLDTFKQFASEPSGAHETSDGVITYVLPTFTRIAMPEALFSIPYEYTTLSYVFRFYLNLEQAFIIIGARSSLQPDNSLNVPRRWELQDIQAPMLFWNYDSGLFEWRDTVDGSKEPFDPVLERACEWLNEWLIFHGKEHFEVRSAFAVRK